MAKERKTKKVVVLSDRNIALLAAALSVASFFVSLRGCEISQQALDLARSDSIAETLLVLAGQVQADGESFVLKPISQDIALQSLSYTFPKQIGGEKRVSVPPKFEVSIPIELAGLKSQIASSVPKEAGYVKFKPEAYIPFLVRSYSVSKGQVRYDQSIYALSFSFVVSDQPGVDPKIEINGIAFAERLPESEDGDYALSNRWELVSRANPSLQARRP